MKPRLHSLLPVSLVTMACLLAAIVLVPGCSPRPPEYKATDGDKAEDQNPWAKVATALRKDSDTPACRQTLAQLNNDLAVKPNPELQPASLAPDAEKALKDALQLKDNEVKEIRSSSYGGLDPHYLAECLYLADAARAMGVDGLPPTRQAELAFRWVCRQLTVAPWLREFPEAQKALAWAVPPMHALRRGSGSGLERAYVYLALLQQLGLDGCLVGGPEAANLVGSPLFGIKERPVPHGPFWAVGARVGADVVLFDPWRGEPLPGPEGRIATIAQVRANPDLLKPWRDDKTQPWTISPDAVKGATAYLTCPLSGLAPRMRRLEQELKSDLPMKLSVDPLAVKARFLAEAKLDDTKLWNPPGDVLTPTRTHGSFFTIEDGGFVQPEGPTDDLYKKYLVSLVPQSVFVVPADLLPQAQGDLDSGVPEATSRLKGGAWSTFTASFVTPPNSREQIQRGNFAQVTAALVTKRKGYAAALQRVQTDRTRETDIAQWSKKARAVYERLSKARRSDNPTEQLDAQTAVDLFWRNEAGIANVIVESAVAEAGLAEATYLLAMSLHEQAERADAKLEQVSANPREKANVEKARKDASQAWVAAKEWWTLYEQGPAAIQDRTYPGRATHAKQTAARAATRTAELGAR